MNDRRRLEAERYCRAVVDGDAEFVETVDDSRQPWLVAAIAACFIAYIRSRLDPADDSAIARAASAPALYDAENRRIPPWIIEGTVRMALGELTAAEGIPPQALIDTHVTFVGHGVAGMSGAERDRLVAAAVDVVLNSSVAEPPEGSPA